MLPLLESTKNLSCLTPAELADRNKDPNATGNKAAFFRAALGIMTEAEAARLQQLIDDCCERIDE